MSPEIARVKYKYVCGHREEFDTPGVKDPAGILLTHPRSLDGIITVESLNFCRNCRGYLNA